MGPPLLPVISVEPPVLNQEDIRLEWMIYPVKTGRQTTLTYTIKKETLHLITDQITKHLPTGITVYRIESDNRHNILHYYNYSEVPNQISLNNAVRIQLWFLNARYAQIKKMTFRPSVFIESKEISGATLEFLPKRDHTYVWYQFPFMMPPVR